MYREEERDSDTEEKIEESFDNPVYGPAGKSAYNAPAPAPVLPASYAAYLAGLGYGLPYAYGPYSRYGAFPYSSPAGYGYGSLLNNPGFLSSYLSGLGYAGYGNSYLGRSLYPGFGYGYPGFLSGLGYPSAPLRRGPVPVGPTNSPVVGVAPTVPRAALPAPFGAVPPPQAGVPPPVPAPVAPFANTIPGVPAPVTAAFPYRAPYRAIKGKDGAIRYIPVDIQNLYK